MQRNIEITDKSSEIDLGATAKTGRQYVSYSQNCLNMAVSPLKQLGSFVIVLAVL